MSDRSLWEPGPPLPREEELDALVRPALLMEPPDAVQQAILAAVLQATALPAAVPLAPSALPWYPTPVMPPGTLPESAEDARPIPLAAYALLAAVLVAYVAALSWLNGVLGESGWLTTLVAQLLSVAELVVGRPDAGQPLALAWQILQQAPWLVLLPLAWALWERDRASSSAA